MDNACRLNVIPQQRLHIKLGNVLLEELPKGLLATPIGKFTHGQPILRAQVCR